jgi:ubiquitin-conjugating enzyme E2 O
MLSTLISEAGDYFAAHGQEMPPRKVRTGSELSPINWYGEVRDLRLNGEVDVMLPDKRTVTATLDRLVVFDDILGDDTGLLMDSFDPDGDVSMEAEAGSEDSWETDDGPDEWIDVGTDREVVTVDEIVLDVQPSEDSSMKSESTAGPATTTAGGSAAEKKVEVVDVEVPGGSLAVAKGKDEDEGPWKRFEILEQAPVVSGIFFSPTAFQLWTYSESV